MPRGEFRKWFRPRLFGQVSSKAWQSLIRFYFAYMAKDAIVLVTIPSECGLEIRGRGDGSRALDDRASHLWIEGDRSRIYEICEMGLTQATTGLRIIKGRDRVTSVLDLEVCKILHWRNATLQHYGGYMLMCLSDVRPSDFIGSRIGAISGCAPRLSDLGSP